MIFLIKFEHFPLLTFYWHVEKTYENASFYSLKVGGFSLLTTLTPSLFIEERKVNSRLWTGYPGCLFLQFCIGFWNQNLDNFPSLYQGTCWRQLFNILSVIRFAQSQKIGMPDNLKVLGTKKSKQSKQKTKQNTNTKEHKLYL